MIAEKGSFTGTLNDICDYLEINRTSKNRSKIKSILLQEEKDGLVETTNLTASTAPSSIFTLKVIPKEEAIIIDDKWLNITKLRSVEYSRSIDWTSLLKVLLWIYDYYKDSDTKGTEFKNEDIARDTNLSSSTVTDAKKVLENDLNAIAIKKNYVISNINNEATIRVTGQVATPNAWIEY